MVRVVVGGGDPSARASDDPSSMETYAWWFYSSTSQQAKPSNARTHLPQLQRGAEPVQCTLEVPLLEGLHRLYIYIYI